MNFTGCKQNHGIFVAMAALISAVPASADIISTTGITLLGAPPASVQLNALESNTTIFAFQEQMNAVLNAPLLVDVTAPGTYDQYSSLPLPSFLAAGLTVNSYYLSADPDLNLVSLDYVFYLGRSLTFSPGETVIGIQIFDRSLLLGAAALGASGTKYPPLPINFGLNFATVPFPGSDSLSLSADRRTVNLDLITGSGIDSGGVDQIRIITSAAPSVPEPGTVLLMLSGLAGVGAARRVYGVYKKPV